MEKDIKTKNQQTYKKIIKNMEEDEKELSEQTIKDIELVRKSKTISNEEVKKRLGFD